MPLRSLDAISFLATSDAAKSKAFFEQLLGLQLLEETDFAIVFQLGNGSLRIQKVQQVSPSPYTAMGWQVKDIGKLVGELADKGIEFERHEGLPQSDSGVWASPSGAKIAWFKDPDGNILSLTQR